MRCGRWRWLAAGAAVLALAGCGGTAAATSAPHPAASQSSCAARIRLADPSLTPAQATAVCAGQVPAASPPASPSATAPPTWSASCQITRYGDASADPQVTVTLTNNLGINQNAADVLVVYLSASGQQLAEATVNIGQGPVILAGQAVTDTDSPPSSIEQYGSSGAVVPAGTTCRVLSVDP
jgi:hypothetical protein